MRVGFWQPYAFAYPTQSMMSHVTAEEAVVTLRAEVTGAVLDGRKPRFLTGKFCEGVIESSDDYPE